MNPVGDPASQTSSQATGDGKRSWLTAAEFLGQVEAHRVAKLKERRNGRRPYVPGPFVRTYQLNPHLMYQPKPKAARNQEVAHE